VSRDQLEREAVLPRLGIAVDDHVQPAGVDEQQAAQVKDHLSEPRVAQLRYPGGEHWHRGRV
jgi:hypothetical protein